jgi:hypothetical protein
MLSYLKQNFPHNNMPATTGTATQNPLRLVTDAIAQNPLLSDYVSGNQRRHEKIKTLPHCFPQDVVFKIVVPLARRQN